MAPQLIELVLDFTVAVGFAVIALFVLRSLIEAFGSTPRVYRRDPEGPVGPAGK